MHDLALSFFMHDPEKRLPGLDEVLICQSDTPLEQVQPSSSPLSTCCLVLTPVTGTVVVLPPGAGTVVVLTPVTSTVVVLPLEQVQL